jgi:suppressor of ftsI
MRVARTRWAARRGAGVAWCLASVLPVSQRAQAQLCGGTDTSGVQRTASRDLYCLALVAAPGVPAAVMGRVELGHPPGPFTVAVTADGRIVYAPVASVAGLPAPSALGAYTVYVAWVLPPTMFPATRLGVITNGTTRLRDFALDPFVVLITAESRGDVIEPTGRIVLRGGSPSSRLQPPDMLQFTAGAMRDPSPRDSGMPMAGMSAGMTMGGADSATPHAATHRADTVRWSGVPMPAGLMMVPGEMALRPATSPYLPAVADSAAVPPGVARAIVRLLDGDTLHLTAGLVTRIVRGQRLLMYAYNGQYPGPLLSVRRGATIFVDLINHLDQPTTIHWHGIRLDEAFDGVPDMPQPAVAIGGRFTYRVHFPDAGIYWYHPHVREDMQQNLGLAGNILVEDRATDSRTGANRTEPVVLGDLLLGDDGLVPFGRTATTHALMGRFGNVLLVNGEPRASFTAARGDIVRFLFTNAANARTFNLSFPGARMKLVGSDAGYYERESWVESIVIAPAERYIVDVRFNRPGTTLLVNRVRGLDHFFNRFFFETDTLADVRVAAARAGPDQAARSARYSTLRADRAAAAEIDRYRSYFDRPADRTLELAMTSHGLPFVTRLLMQLDSSYFAPVEWSGTMPGMNWAATTDQVRWILRDPATGRENMDIGWTFTRGAVIKLRLINTRQSFHAMQHPIHVHGQRFLVLAVNGVSNRNLVWKDTVQVPAGATVDILLDLSNPGRWMLHCHIAEHLAAQMMTVFTVQ